MFSGRAREFSICAGLAVAVWMVFGQVAGHGYINFDDFDYVGENYAVLDGLSWEAVKFAFTSRITANWHPITWLSYMADAHMFGENPGAMHGVNAIIHACNAVLLFVVLRYLTSAVWRSAAVAALFAIHPLHVEPVAWLSDRKDLLATFFWLLTALTWAWWARGSRSWRWFAVAHLWAVLALMSKPTAVTLPFTLLILDFWPLGRIASLADLGRRAWEKSLVFALAAAQSVITFFVQRDLGATAALHDVSFARKIANVVTAYGTYLWQTVWPSDLCPMYPFPESIAIVPLVGAGVAVIAISAFALARLQRQPYLAAGWFWYLGVLVPMIGLVQVGGQAHADRYTYVALIGVFWMVAWGLRDLLGEARWQSTAIRSVAVVVVAALAWKSYAQTAYWQNDFTLFNHTLDVTTRNRLANTVVGLAHLRSKSLDQAESHIRTAMDIDPRFMPSYRHLAEVLFAKGKPEEAVKLLDKAIQLVPEGQISYYNRGIVLKALERNPEAVADFEKALAMGLEDDEAKRAHLELGLIRAKEGKPEEALKHFQRAVDIDPFYYLGQKNLAFAHYQMKNYKEARTRFMRLAQVNPGDQDVRNALRSMQRR